MKITKLHVSNYKGIVDLEIDFAKFSGSNVITLVGLNESGKTTILEAIKSVISGVHKSNQSSLIPRKDQHNFNGEIHLEMSLSLDDTDKEIAKKVARYNSIDLLEIGDTLDIKRVYTYNTSKPVKELDTWSFHSLVRKKRGKKTGRLYEVDTPAWQELIKTWRMSSMPEVLYHPNFLFEIPSKIYIDAKGREDSRNRDYYNMLEDVLQTASEGGSIENLINKRYLDGTQEDRRNYKAVLHKMSKLLTSRIAGTWKTLFQGNNLEIYLELENEELEVKAVGSNPATTIDRVYISLFLRENDDIYNISERSLGFRWFLTFFLFTEFRVIRDRKKRQLIFLLDEPASNLHSSAQSKILNSFENIIDGNLLIYATHSKDLINPEWLESTFVVRNKAVDNELEYSFGVQQANIEAMLYRRFVAQNPSKTTYFQPILDLIEYKPGLLEEVPNVVVMEGKNDYYMINYVSSQLGIDKKFGVFPATSADKIQFIIALYLSWGRNFIILLDGDNGGEKAKKRYIKEYGKAIEGRVFSLTDINSKLSGKATEDLFYHSDQLKIIRVLKPEESGYNKELFAAAIQDCLVRKKEVSLTKTTLDNFTQVLEFISAQFEKLL